MEEGVEEEDEEEESEEDKDWGEKSLTRSSMMGTTKMEREVRSMDWRNLKTIDLESKCERRISRLEVLEMMLRKVEMKTSEKGPSMKERIFLMKNLIKFPRERFAISLRTPMTNPYLIM